MNKRLYILVGPKGSGKTFIGSLVGKRTTITFLRVEPIWLNIKDGEDGWTRVSEEICRQFENTDEIIIETLGIGQGFKKFYSFLKEKYEIRLIRVNASVDKCLERVRTRDNAEHIPVSDDKVEKYNQIAVKVQMDWDAEIDNDGPAEEETIIETIKGMSL
ncbi:shikimate kinase [Candidatus Hydrogenedentota bacterium]